MEENVEIIETGEGVSNIKNQCPHCGARELKYNEKLGKIYCLYCDGTFDPKELEGVEKDLKNLNNTRVGSGARDIDKNFEDIMTFKCPGCGAEVVVDTKTSTQARCHWCHGVLTINERIENGAVPDAILPFKVKKEEAIQSIKNFVSSRQFYALPEFKKEFTTENTFGVYFPYLLVDVNAHCTFVGEGEEYVRSYTDDKSTYYDARAYNVKRDFDITIDDLTIESSSDKLDNKNKDKTNNIINAIMPFDTENCVKFESNFLVGYSSEKRDVNISDLKNKSDEQVKDVVRASLNNTLQRYSRGVCWKSENVNIVGSQWISAYLPVWLYSYHQKTSNGEMEHFIAVNARTKEVMGSVPLNKTKLVIISLMIVILSCYIIKLPPFSNDDKQAFIWDVIFHSLVGVIYYNAIRRKYRNANVRHKHEKETKNTISNLKQEDVFIGDRKRLSSSKIIGCNNTLVKGDKVSVNTTNNEEKK